MYLPTAATDLLREYRAADYKKLTTAIERLWTNAVACEMYVTGGIGAMSQREGFGIDDFLPHRTEEGICYAENRCEHRGHDFADRLQRGGERGKKRTVECMC